MTSLSIQLKPEKLDIVDPVLKECQPAELLIIFASQVGVGLGYDRVGHRLKIYGTPGSALAKALDRNGEAIGKFIKQYKGCDDE